MYYMYFFSFMLKQFLQKAFQIMTKVSNDVPAASTAEAALHHVQVGKIEKREAGTEETKPPRIKYKRYAMLLSYQGKKYFGMQLQNDLPTIESHLLIAMHKLGWITDEERNTPFKFFFQRAARTDKAVSAARQICGMQLPLIFDYEKNGAEELNKILPPDIRAMGMRRAMQRFHPQKQCDARTYSYTLPTFAFAKPHELTNGSFRITRETIDEIKSLLSVYVGSHNFFNYTSRKEFGDASCQRVIRSFACGEPFIFKDTVRDQDVEFITLTVKGQSFILHQIRKMVGAIITIVRELQLKSFIQRSFESDRVDVPKAPGLGLLLERVHYDYYDKKYTTNNLLPLTNWGEEVEAEIEKVKYEMITKDVLSTELMSQSMMQWLAELPRHDFGCDPESDQKPQKTFLTMACAKVAEAQEKAANAVGIDNKTEQVAEKDDTSVSTLDEETEIKKEAVA